MQIASLNADLGSSKEREEQLSKKLAASWKEVSNISRECEALRLGGEEQEKGMDEAQEKLREFMLLVRDFEEKESLHQKHHAELQAAAFDMSSQLLMSDREVLRSRKELSRALAGEARVRSDADEQLKTLSQWPESRGGGRTGVTLVGSQESLSCLTCCITSLLRQIY